MYYSVPNTIENRRLIGGVYGHFFISGDRLVSVPIDRDTRHDILKYEEKLTLVFGNTWSMEHYKEPEDNCTYTIATTVEHYIPNSWIEIDEGVNKDSDRFTFMINDLSVIEDPSIVIGLTYDNERINLHNTELDFTKFTNLDNINIYSVPNINLLQLPNSIKYVELYTTVNMIIIDNPGSVTIGDVRYLYNSKIDMTMWDWLNTNGTGSITYDHYLEFMAEGNSTKSARH